MNQFYQRQHDIYKTNNSWRTTSAKIDIDSVFRNDIVRDIVNTQKTIVSLCGLNCLYLFLDYLVKYLRRVLDLEMFKTGVFSSHHLQL